MKTKLVVVGGRATQREIELELPAQIGRERGAALLVVHPTVSRQHCELIERDGHVVLRDLGSTNGTFVANERITETVLAPGGRFTIGPLTFSAEYEPANGAAVAAPPAESASAPPAPSTDDDDFAITATLPLPEPAQENDEDDLLALADDNSGEIGLAPPVAPPAAAAASAAPADASDDLHFDWDADQDALPPIEDEADSHELSLNEFAGADDSAEPLAAAADDAGFDLLEDSASGELASADDDLGFDLIDDDLPPLVDDAVVEAGSMQSESAELASRPSADESVASPELVSEELAAEDFSRGDELSGSSSDIATNDLLQELGADAAIVDSEDDFAIEPSATIKDSPAPDADDAFGWELTPADDQAMPAIDPLDTSPTVESAASFEAPAGEAEKMAIEPAELPPLIADDEDLGFLLEDAAAAPSSATDGGIDAALSFERSPESPAAASDDFSLQAEPALSDELAIEPLAESQAAELPPLVADDEDLGFLLDDAPAASTEDVAIEPIDQVEQAGAAAADEFALAEDSPSAFAIEPECSSSELDLAELQQESANDLQLDLDDPSESLEVDEAFEIQPTADASLSNEMSVSEEDSADAELNLAPLSVPPADSFDLGPIAGVEEELPLEFDLADLEPSSPTPVAESTSEAGDIAPPAATIDDELSLDSGALSLDDEPLALDDAPPLELELEDPVADDDSDSQAQAAPGATPPPRKLLPTGPVEPWEFSIAEPILAGAAQDTNVPPAPPPATPVAADDEPDFLDFDKPAPGSVDSDSAGVIGDAPLIDAAVEEEFSLDLGDIDQPATLDFGPPEGQAAAIDNDDELDALAFDDNPPLAGLEPLGDSLTDALGGERLEALDLDDSAATKDAPVETSATAMPPAKAKKRGGRSWWPFGRKKKGAADDAAVASDLEDTEATPPANDIVQTTPDLAATTVFSETGINDLADSAESVESPESLSLSDAELQALDQVREPQIVDSFELDELDLDDEPLMESPRARLADDEPIVVPAAEEDDEPDLALSEPGIAETMKLEPTASLELDAEAAGLDPFSLDDPLADLEQKESQLLQEANDEFADLSLNETVEFVPSDILPDTDSKAAPAGDAAAENSTAEPAAKKGFRWWPFGRKSGEPKPPKAPKPPKVKKEKKPKPDKKKKGAADVPAVASDAPPALEVEEEVESLEIEFDDVPAFDSGGEPAGGAVAEDDALDFLEDIEAEPPRAAKSKPASDPVTPRAAGKPTGELTDADLDDFLKDF